MLVSTITANNNKQTNKQTQTKRTKHRDLLALDLCPAGIVANEGANGHIVALEGVKLGNAVAGRAVAPQQPHIVVWAAQLGTKCKATTNTCAYVHSSLSLLGQPRELQQQSPSNVPSVPNAPGSSHLSGPRGRAT